MTLLRDFVKLLCARKKSAAICEKRPIQARRECAIHSKPKCTSVWARGSISGKYFLYSSKGGFLIIIHYQYYYYYYYYYYYHCYDWSQTSLCACVWVAACHWIRSAVSDWLQLRMLHTTLVSLANSRRGHGNWGGVRGGGTGLNEDRFHSLKILQCSSVASLETCSPSTRHTISYEWWMDH